MDTPFVPHDTFSFDPVEFTSLIERLDAMIKLIPPPPPITNTEFNKKAKMADIRETESDSVVEIFKNCTSYLPENLAYSLMIQKQTSFKQSKMLDTKTTTLTNAQWKHGDLSGADLLIMMSLAEKLTRVHAKLGNKEAIIAANGLDDLNRKRGGGNNKNNESKNKNEDGKTKNEDGKTKNEDGKTKDGGDTPPANV